MAVFEVLIVGTFITSTITMIIVSMTVLPNVKQAMVVVRDATLWIALVLFIAASIWVGWHRFGYGDFLTGAIGNSPSAPAQSMASPASTSITDLD